MFQIMVVEDDTNTRRLMETVLKQHGYQPILACDGVEALENEGLRRALIAAVKAVVEG